MHQLRHITPRFRERVAQLRANAPAAAAFLERLADRPPTHVALSTATNAHLYVRDAFVAYVCVGTPQDPGVLRWSPRFNQQIAGGTFDGSHALLPGRFDRLVALHDGLGAGWARANTDGTRVVRTGAPVAFFDDLWETIAALDPRDGTVA